MPLITQDLNQAIKDLQQGKPVAIPTETVYGLAAMIDHEVAIKAVFTMKNRPLNHPLIIHIEDGFDLNTLVTDIPSYATQLIKHFWPGPLTLVLRAKEGKINPLITGGQSTVAIRCPAHPLAMQVLKAIKTPLVAPSANPFGKISPTTAQHVQQSFSNETLTILDGGRCSVGIESTIIDASDPQTYQILRHGFIDAQAIAHVVCMEAQQKANAIRVPGKLDNHYQPQKPLYYFDNNEQINTFCQNKITKTYVIASQKPDNIPSSHFHAFSCDPQKAAFELFYQLRVADESNATCIAIALPPSTNPWQGVRERILKAGSPFIEHFDEEANKTH